MPASSAPAGLTVVVADDSDAVRRHLVAAVSDLDAVGAVEEACDVASTLRSVQALRPGVVTLDIQMPGGPDQADGNGLTALRHIKRTAPRTCVIMLTNHSNAFYRAACREAGADFFLDKSAEFEKVGHVIGQIAGRA